MKMVYLKNSKLKLFLCILYLGSFNIYSQINDSNFILMIDDNIVTDNIHLEFTGVDDSTINYKYNYRLGKELNLPENILNLSKISLRFNYSTISKNENVDYVYNFEFKKGWLDNSSFLILKIYNLDKKKFKKAFCNRDDKYLIEIHNSVYKESIPRCR